MEKRHLDDLYGPDRFDAWITAICRNVCHRYVRDAGQLARRQTTLPDVGPWDQWDEFNEVTQPEIAAADAFDSVTELERQDLQTLLDRALGYLAEPAREAVALCYLVELPQREAAAFRPARMSRMRANVQGLPIGSRLGVEVTGSWMN